MDPQNLDVRPVERRRSHRIAEKYNYKHAAVSAALPMEQQGRGEDTVFKGAVGGQSQQSVSQISQFVQQTVMPMASLCRLSFSLS